MYREVGLIQVVEILRRWQAGESARAIARATGIARNTVGKYLDEVERLGIVRQGAPPANDQILALGRLGHTAPEKRSSPQANLLDPHREQIVQWIQGEKLQLTRVLELLQGRQIPVKLRPCAATCRPTASPVVGEIRCEWPIPPLARSLSSTLGASA